MIDGGLRRIFQKHLFDFHWQSVESWSTGRGVPDLNYCWKGSEGWIETKKANGWRCNISPEQIAWLERRARAGGRVYLAVRRLDTPVGFWLFKGGAARNIGSLLQTKPLIHSPDHPAHWPWATIRSILTD